MTRSAAAASLLQSIRARHARAGVIGLGYVGLPLAVEFARAGYPTTGIDLDTSKVHAINDDLQRCASVVVDTRNAIRSPRPHVIRLGAARPIAVEPAVSVA